MLSLLLTKVTAKWETFVILVKTKMCTMKVEMLWSTLQRESQFRGSFFYFDNWFNEASYQNIFQCWYKVSGACVSSPIYGKKIMILVVISHGRKEVAGHILSFQDANKCLSIFIISLSFSLSAFPSSHCLYINYGRKDISLCDIKHVHWPPNNALLCFRLNRFFFS